MSDDQARGFSRRGFLKVTAAASLGTAATAAGITPTGVPTAAAEELPPIPPHGAELRGMDLVTQSPTTEGRFGFMFKNQPPHPASDTMLDSLGELMEEAASYRRAPGTRDSLDSPTKITTTRPTRTRTGRSRPGSPSSASSSTTTSPSTPRSSATSSPTPTQPPTSARPATTSTPSTGRVPARTRSSTTPTTGTSS